MSHVLLTEAAARDIGRLSFARTFPMAGFIRMTLAGGFDVRTFPLARPLGGNLWVLPMVYVDFLVEVREDGIQVVRSVVGTEDAVRLLRVLDRREWEATRTGRLVSGLIWFMGLTVPLWAVWTAYLLYSAGGPGWGGLAVQVALSLIVGAIALSWGRRQRGREDQLLIEAAQRIRDLPHRREMGVYIDYGDGPRVLEDAKGDEVKGDDPGGR